MNCYGVCSPNLVAAVSKIYDVYSTLIDGVLLYDFYLGNNIGISAGCNSTTTSCFKSVFLLNSISNLVRAEDLTWQVIYRYFDDKCTEFPLFDGYYCKKNMKRILLGRIYWNY